MAWGSTSDVLAVTNAAIAQITAKADGTTTSGLTELSAMTDTNIVDLGEKLSISSGEVTNGSPADIFFKSLLSQIARVVVDTRSYAAQLPSLFVDTREWGLISEMIRIDLSDCMVDEMWNPDGFVNWNTPQSGGVYPGVEEGKRIAALEFGCFKPPVRAKLYKKATGIMVALTKAQEQMFTAFRSASEYESFAAGLLVSVQNTLQLKAEVYALMCVSVGIAKCVYNGNTINLLSEYLTLHPSSTVTAATCLEDADFLRYSLRRISDVRENLKRYTAAYNNHESLAFSSPSNLILLSQYTNACKFNVRANTFNEELLGIGDFDKVSSWQAVVSSVDATPFSFGNASALSLTAAALSEISGTTVSDPAVYSGVIGVLYDRMAMGVLIDKKKVTSQYSATRDTVNFFHHSLVQYIVNDEYPIVTFYVEDPPTPEPGG